ncbi:MAG TPA: 50S ribosomal protein L11 methyltransferase [Solirubrobacteraceae bacterium]|nr:50S ribosomal protein L11 methyltransferase [Solirubrobacteraceae bacterium]
MIRLAIRVQRAEAEIVLAQLLELAPTGVEEVDLDAQTVEYAVYGAPGELPELPELRVAAGSALVEVRTTDVRDDWSERWKQFHRPVLIGAGRGALWVRPPWGPGPPPGVHDLVIDPGQAFGTGAHATTRLCLEHLVELAAEGAATGALCDAGCGSGVLAIAAARLGWSPVQAFDHERESVAATASNARANGVDVAVARRDLRDGPPPGAALVAANLVRGLLLELSRQITDPPRVLIAGGLLEAEEAEVAAEFAGRHGLDVHSRRSAEGWVALRLER